MRKQYSGVHTLVVDDSEGFQVVIEGVANHDGVGIDEMV